MSTSATAPQQQPARLQSVRQAWRHRIQKANLPPSAKLVGYALALYMNDAGVCWPSYAELRKATRLSDDTLARMLTLLHRRRYITRSRPDRRLGWTFTAMLRTRDRTMRTRDRTTRGRGRTNRGPGPHRAARNQVLNQGLNQKTKALSATRTAKSKSRPAIATPDEYVAHVRSTLGPRGAPKPAPARDSQLEKQLALRDQARGRRR